MPEKDTTPAPPDAPAIPKRTRGFSPQTMANLFATVDLTVKGIRANPEIQTALVNAYNYGPADVTALETQAARAKALCESVLRAQGAQLAQTATVNVQFKTARKATADFAVMCRTELKSVPGALAALGLTQGAAPLALGAFLSYAETLFDNALQATPDVKAILARRGYDAARLTAEKAKLDALKAANAAQESAKSRSQSLTPAQTDAFKAVQAEVNKLRKYARRALADKPQLLEAIGVKA